MRHLPKLLAAVALLFSSLFDCPGLSLAAEANPQTVQIKIGTILASNESDDFDARLKPLQKQLKLMKYRSYRLLKEETQSAHWQASVGFEIPGGRSLVVTPQEQVKKQLALKVRLLQREEPLLDTTVRIPSRGHFLLGGPPHEGGILILSISATAP
jgi:hypothetical protein